MYRTYFDDLATAMYPSRLLHSFGVNGKVSGSIGVAGEIGGNVMAILHGPLGCGFHYRFSARRRHEPFYRILTTDLQEQEIVFGGDEKLEKTIRAAWEQYHPDLILVIPTPISDILNESVTETAGRLREEGIPVVGVQSELFSHRDKNYAKNRLKEISKQKLTGDNRLEMELKGCGFTEALYAIVGQFMEKQEIIPYSVNIETVGWGSEGKSVLREIEQTLNQAGVVVNTWIPSAAPEQLKKAPAAQLNLVKQIRWARKMRDIFGTDYLHINDSGRYVGLDGISQFYRDIGEMLDIADQMESVIQWERARVLRKTESMRNYIFGFHGILVCRGLQSVPFTLKTYAKELGIHVDAVCVVQTERMKISSGITPEVEKNLMVRIHDAIDLFSPGTKLYVNPDRDELRGIFAGADVVVGSDDFTLEGLGAPMVPAVDKMSGPSFDSYIRLLNRFASCLRTAKKRDELILNRMSFDTDNYPRYENDSTAASRRMWEEMWLDRRKGERS